MTTLGTPVSAADATGARLDPPAARNVRMTGAEMASAAEITTSANADMTPAKRSGIISSGIRVVAPQISAISNRSRAIWNRVRAMRTQLGRSATLQLISALRTEGRATVRLTRSTGVALGVTVVAWVSVGSAGGQVTYVDQDFDFANYTIVHFQGGLGGSASLTQQGAGGNPGAYGLVSLGITGGTPPVGYSGSWSWVTAVANGFTVNPADFGAIAAIDASAQSFWISGSLGPTAQNNGIVVEQGGSIFYAAMPLTSTGGWQSAQRLGILAADFSRIVNSGPVFLVNEHPDFSAAGAPIRVGAIRGNSNGPQGNYQSYTNSAGIDNLSITVRPCIALVPQSPIPVVCTGSQVQISANVAMGAGPFTYQWQVQDPNAPGGWLELADGPLPGVGTVTGATMATLSIGLDGVNGDVRDLAFRCIVTNACGSTTSDHATLTIDLVPSITGQPASASLCPTESAVFAVSAIEADTFQWQWQPNGTGTAFVDLPEGTVYNAAGEACFITSGTRTASLEIARTSLFEETKKCYSMRCVATGPCGSATSNETILALETSPHITAQPQDAIACSGEVSRFTVVAEESEPFTFQWQIEDAAASTGWSDLSNGPVILNSANIGTALGTGTHEFVFQNNQSNLDLIRFRCVVTNDCASVTSNPATLTICSADFDCSGDVTVPDIFAFLAAWFSQSPGADFNSDEVINVPDIFAFLAAWFAGCP